MTYDAAKEHLHYFIEKADKEKVLAMYTLLEQDITKEEFTYDAATMAEIKKLSNDAFEGIAPTYTWQQVLDNANSQRRK
jgi:hypothetical protein